jgi:hypothetical protein
MISGTGSSESASGVTSEVIQRIAFAVAGILILVDALSPLRQLIQGISYRISNSPVNMPELSLEMYGLEVGIRFVLGAWLLLGIEKRTRRLQRAKSLGDQDR